MSNALPLTPSNRDPGLQPERTALSWNRTALAVAVNAALVLRAGLISEAGLFIAVGVLLLLAAIAATAYSSIRKRQLVRDSAHPADPVTSSSLALMLAAGITLLACAAGIASILTLR